jgi:hypothetical protein
MSKGMDMPESLIRRKKGTDFRGWEDGSLFIIILLILTHLEVDKCPRRI